MSQPSESRFLVLHALRVRGFLSADATSELAALPTVEVVKHLKQLETEELARYRDNRDVWQLTPPGREAHLAALAKDVASAKDQLAALYPDFLVLNGELKSLCSNWQSRNGEVNDHTDATYDGVLITHLGELQKRATTVLDAMARSMARLAGYSPRLAAAVAAVRQGETNRFAGVLCASYHDVWMELHEDLLLSLGVERASEET
jgi:hypothetical protein